MGRLGSRDQHVVGLQIAVRETGRVRGGQAVGDLHGQVQQLARRIDGRDGRAVDVLHHQVAAALGQLPDVVQLADVRMVQRRDRARLAAKRSENSVLDVLMATIRSSRVSRAFQTSPMPPAPSGAMISNGPERVADRERHLGRPSLPEGLGYHGRLPERDCRDRGVEGTNRTTPQQTTVHGALFREHESDPTRSPALPEGAGWERSIARTTRAWTALWP